MKSASTIAATLIILLLATLTHGQSTFKNPILTGMNPDPSICRAGDDYYLVTSTFEYFPGIPVYQSKDLVHWKLIGYALARASNNPLTGCDASGGQYAATIRYHDGTFYVTGTNYGGQGSQGEFYVTATDPTGPWSDPYWVGTWYVDPSFLFEGDTAWFHSPDNNGSFLLGVMDTETGKVTGEMTTIAEGLGGSSPEGPHMYKRGDYYYLLSAEGGTGYQHRAVIQRSTSSWGPYEASPVNPVVSHMNDPDNSFQAIGHVDMVETPVGWWMVCLGIRPVDGKYHHLGRETFLAPVTWNENGWPKVGTDGVVQEEYPVPDLPQHIWGPEPIRDDFDSSSLRLVWNFLRNPNDNDWSLTEKPGYLRLNGTGINFSQKESPAFICRRQTAFEMVASAKISFTPTAENEEAGLVIRGNDINRYDFLITMHEGKRSVMLRSYLQDTEAATVYREIPDGDVILRIDATEREYRFSVQQEGGEPNLIGTTLTKEVATETIAGFTGVFLGMYASGNGSPNVNPADFDWFAMAVEGASGVSREPSSDHIHVAPVFSATSIDYTLSAPLPVWLQVFDLSGREVLRVVDAVQPVGNYSVPLHSLRLPRGVYLYRFQTGAYAETRRVIVRR